MENVCVICEAFTCLFLSMSHRLQGSLEERAIAKEGGVTRHAVIVVLNAQVLRHEAQLRPSRDVILTRPSVRLGYNYSFAEENLGGLLNLGINAWV